MRLNMILLPNVLEIVKGNVFITIVNEQKTGFLWRHVNENASSPLVVSEC